MKRTGQCNACGACCELIGFPVDLGVPGYEEWLTARGWQLRGYMAMKHDPCPHLTDDNKCDLHFSGKPDVCRKYPLVLTDRLDCCGFSFVDE